LLFSTPVIFAILALQSSAFVNHNSPTFGTRKSQSDSKTAVMVAPTLFIYWSIKTAFDSVSYALGQTDEVKGTGVWSSFKLKREKSTNDDDNQDDKDEKKEKE